MPSGKSEHVSYYFRHRRHACGILQHCPVPVNTMVKCKNCGITNCVSVLCKQHLAKMQAFERSEPPSAKVLSKQAKPSATIAKKTKAGKAKAVKELTEKSKEDQKNDKKVNKKDKVDLEVFERKYLFLHQGSEMYLFLLLGVNYIASSQQCSGWYND